MDWQEMGMIGDLLALYEKKSCEFMICSDKGYLSTPMEVEWVKDRSRAYKFKSLSDAECRFNELFPEEIDQKGIMIVGCERL
jgi:hypothetical protein